MLRDCSVGMKTKSIILVAYTWNWLICFLAVLSKRKYIG